MTSDPSSRPTWQLPRGVCRGAWDYANAPSIATEYDAFHRDHPLLVLDQQIIAGVVDQIESHSIQDPLAIDLGCGTGRTILPLAQRGWQTMGIDLSMAMLREVRVKSQASSLDHRVASIHANIVQLDFLRDEVADLITCMYSSFGMIKGRENRAAVLGHVQRILKPKGRWILHVHNRGAWIRDPRGIPLTISGWVRSKRDRQWELGDRIYAYRGLPNMFLHIFSRSELRKEIQKAGLKVDRILLLNRHSSGLLAMPQFCPHIRAGGFIAIGSKG